MLTGAVRKGPYVPLLTVWKSVACRAAVPKMPFLISTMKPWKAVTGLPPPTMPNFRTLSMTLMTVALSGMTPVLKDRMPRYCFLFASSPRLKAEPVLLRVPPLLLVSANSSTQPSCAPTEDSVNVRTVGVRVRVAVAVLVGVLVSVGVLVAVLVGVCVAVRVGVLVTVFVGVLVVVSVGVCVAVRVGVLVAVSVGVGVSVSVGVKVLVAVSVGVNVTVAVSVGVGVSVAVAVGVRVTVAVSVGVRVMVAVSVGVGVLVAVSVGVGVSVAVSVGVRVGVDVSVGVRVLVAVSVRVGVSVGVLVAVSVGVLVGVGVGGTKLNRWIVPLRPTAKHWLALRQFMPYKACDVLDVFALQLEVIPGEDHAIQSGSFAGRTGWAAHRE